MKNRFLYIMLLAALLVVSTGCNLFSSRFRSSDPFYQSTGGRDFLRIPLLKPYDTIKGSEKHGWTIDMIASPSSIKGVEKFAIENGLIMVHTSLNAESTNAIDGKTLNWYVLIPDKGVERGFDKEEEFQNYILDNGVQKPTWVDPNIVFEQFDKTGCLDWIPDCKLSK